MRTTARLFVAPWYLFGCVSHVYLGLFAPEAYRLLGSSAVVPGYSRFWEAVVMPHIAAWALALAAFELAVGSLLLAGGRWFKTGLALSLLFNVFALQVGFGFVGAGVVGDFVLNRLPTLVFIAIQVPLLFGAEAQALPALLRAGGLGFARAARPA